MKEWTLHVSFDTIKYALRAVKEYESNQIMRIRVYGKHSSILLENDYPFHCTMKSKAKKIKWKLREGNFINNDPKKNADLLMTIMDLLERIIKEENPIL